MVANSIIDNTIGVRLTDARGLSVKDGNLLFRNRFQAIAASGVVIDAAKSLQVTNNVIDANRVGVFATGNCPGTKVADNAVVSNGTNLSTSTATGGWFQPS